MRITSWVRKVKKPSKKVGILSIGVLAGLMVGGGSAYAAAQITSGDIANQTIQSWDVHRGGVKSSEVANQSLHSWDLAPDSVGASEVAEGSIDHSELTDGGVNEEDLSSGVQSKLNSFSGYELIGRTADRTTVPADGSPVTITTECVEGQTAFGGGAKVTGKDEDAKLQMNQSHPSGIHEVSGSETTGNEAGSWIAGSWTVQVTNDGDNTLHVQPYVTCATIG